jgi:glycosyltransferase involved in cell wall biosynthesis
MPDDFERPYVSIVMPVRNEERYIVRAIEGVMEQDYPADRLELLVVDGLSTDCTRELVQEMQRRHPNIRLIDNPGRIVPSGFNAALAHAAGEVILRMDGHCEYPPNYVDQVVRFREEHHCDNFGGVLDPIGDSWTQRAICAAYRSPVGIGGSALRGHSGAHVVQEVDAVHGGCWLLSRLREVEGMDETMVRNQDDELSFRLRKQGGRIMQSTSLRVRYHVRDSFGQLFRQFAQYGYWKVRVIQKHPQQSSLRHYVPGCFLLLALLLAFLGCFLPECRVMLGLLWAAYFAATWLVSAVQLALGRGLSLWPGTVLALLVMHVGYGAGFLLGWARLVYGPLPTDRLFEGITR